LVSHRSKRGDERAKKYAASRVGNVTGTIGSTMPTNATETHATPRAR
jgi:hypothetical protein